MVRQSTIAHATASDSQPMCVIAQPGGFGEVMRKVAVASITVILVALIAGCAGREGSQS